MQKEFPFKKPSPEKEPTTDPNDNWQEKKPFSRAYHFGEVFDEKDKTKDIKMCPGCRNGFSGTGDLRLSVELKCEAYKCKQGHHWAANPETKTIEDLSGK